MHYFHCKSWNVTTEYFRMPYIMTNKWYCYLLKLKNKDCQNIKINNVHSLYFMKVKCIKSLFSFLAHLSKTQGELIVYYFVRRPSVRPQLLKRLLL